MEERFKKPATIQDVAFAAGVSAATVSRVFDPKWEGRIREITREKVLHAARQLSFYPNAIARSLTTSQTNIIAVIVGSEISFFTEEIFFELVRVIQNTGRQVLVFIADPRPGLDHIVSQVNQYRVDGIIILSSATMEPLMRKLEQTKIPVLLFDRPVRMQGNSGVSYICSDNIMGAKLAAEYLVRHGHRRIAYVSGDASTSPSMERSESFKSRIAELGALLTGEFEGDYTYNAGREAMKFFSHDLPDAVFCADDTMAIGLIDEAREMGIAIPDQMSVIGFDDDVASGLESYSLTTIGHQRKKLMQAMASAIISITTDPEMRIAEVYPMEVIVRSSVKSLLDART